MATVSTTLPSDGQTIDASDVNTPINAILSEFNGNIDNDNIKTGANINGAKLLASSLPGSSFDTTLAGGWISGGLPAYSSATNNGNKSYDIVFASTVASLLSPGMRLRTTRTVTAPTQCADLEASSSQYFSRASGSVTGISFVDDFTCMAWVKLESYTGAAQRILSRYTTTTAANGFSFHVNPSGQLAIEGGAASVYRTLLSYQSLPLNKWVHVAGSLNMSANTGELFIDGVLVPSAISGAATALVQAGDLHIGNRGGGTEYLDGKVAQVGLFDAVISASTIRTYISQGLAGTETNCIGAWSLNGVLTDLDSNANTLTANAGALATATDSPFGQDSNGVAAGTTDHALVMKVSTTTATVQVPEGCTIPTSGGVSAVAYSTATSPFGFTLDKGRWAVSASYRVDLVQTNPVAGTVYNLTTTTGVQGGTYLTVPVGVWTRTFEASMYLANATNAPAAYLSLSTGAATESDKHMVCVMQSGITGAAAYIIQSFKRTDDYGINLSAATPYYLNARSGTASATTLQLRGSTDTEVHITATPAGV